MALLPVLPKLPSCNFLKHNGEYCKRKVSPGEGRCWQHATSWRHKLKSLTRNQALIFALTVIGTLAALGEGAPRIYKWYLDVYYPLRVSVPDYIPHSKHISFWLVRNDLRLKASADVFTIMKFTNVTDREITVEALEVELLNGSEKTPVKLSLMTPDESWKVYGGASEDHAVPVSFDSGFLRDVVRQGIPGGHTVSVIGLFQLPKDVPFLGEGGMRLHITDTRGDHYDIDAIVPEENTPGNLNDYVLHLASPVTDISNYHEEPF